MKLLQGDCLEVMKQFSENSIDAICCDPPYGLSFMGKKWDYDVPSIEIWQECLRVLKPGGYLLSFAGTRTQHRMAVRIEDAGFEIRDMIAWVYGSGFPKSLNIGKSIDSKLTTGSAAKNGFHKLEGERREGRIGMYDTVEEQGFRKVNPDQLGAFDHKPTTEEAKQWEGWGTALKPAVEPVSVCSKPLTLLNIFSIIGLEITHNLENVCQKYNVSASDVEQTFQSIHQLLDKVGVNTVHENARTLNWENIENVIVAAVNFTQQSQRLTEKDITKEDFAQENAKENGKSNTSEKITQTGEEEGSNGVDIFISELTEHISENIVLLWKNILEEVLSQANTYTTSMAIRKIIELKTLKLFLYQSISKDTGNSSEVSPNLEPITVARKPLAEKSVAENCLKWGVGGINIDECRVEAQGKDLDKLNSEWDREWSVDYSDYADKVGGSAGFNMDKAKKENAGLTGRFPANLILDGSDEVVELFPNDSQRFFYCAKSSKSERNMGCEGLESKFSPTMGNGIGVKEHDPETATKKNNFHPTVKPIALMEYLIKLVSREGHTVLDPFMGSGSTGIACKKLNRHFIGIEREPDYITIAENRIETVPKTLF